MLDRSVTLFWFVAEDFHPGEEWRDTAGNSIQVQMRGVFANAGQSWDMLHLH